MLVLELEEGFRVFPKEMNIDEIEKNCVLFHDDNNFMFYCSNPILLEQHPERLLQTNLPAPLDSYLIAKPVFAVLKDTEMQSCIVDVFCKWIHEHNLQKPLWDIRGGAAPMDLSAVIDMSDMASGKRKTATKRKRKSKKDDSDDEPEDEEEEQEEPEEEDEMEEESESEEERDDDLDNRDEDEQDDEPEEEEEQDDEPEEQEDQEQEEQEMEDGETKNWKSLMDTTLETFNDKPKKGRKKKEEETTEPKKKRTTKPKENKIAKPKKTSSEFKIPKPRKQKTSDPTKK